MRHKYVVIYERPGKRPLAGLRSSNRAYLEKMCALVNKQIPGHSVVPLD